MRKITKLVAIVSFLFVIGLTLFGCSTEPGEGKHYYYEYMTPKHPNKKNPMEIQRVDTLKFDKGFEVPVSSSTKVFDSVKYGVGPKNPYEYQKRGNGKKLVLKDGTKGFENIDKIGIWFKKPNEELPISSNGLEKVQFDLWLGEEWEGFHFDRYKGKIDENGKPFLNWCVYLRKFWSNGVTDINNLILYKQNFALDFSKAQIVGEKVGFLMTITLSTGTDEYIIPEQSTDIKSKLEDMVLEIRPFEYTKPYIENDYRNNETVQIPIPLVGGETSDDLETLNKKENCNPYLAIKRYKKQITNLRFCYC